MFAHFRFFLKQLLYDLRSGLLLRPGLITASLAALAALVIFIDQRLPSRAFFQTYLSTVFHGEPSAAQTLLATIAGSMMTVISIVYSILIMMLTLASMQFSPRVLAGILRDRKSQNTLGIFVGTFTYCLLVLRTVRGDPEPYVPVLGVVGAILLALLALAALIFFINHIAHRMQANYLVDHIAQETEEVIDAVFPELLEPGETPGAELEVPDFPPGAIPVMAPMSGYVQLIDHKALLELAHDTGLSIYFQKGTGEFAIQGNPLVYLHPAERATAEASLVCSAAFDLGTVRTMQDDVEFGVRQIVDIALKAISPAVNDPSTAATCIDHLGRLLCRIARRRIPPIVELVHERGAMVVGRRATFRSVLDLAINQLRQYGRTDMAVMLRLIRVLHEVALVVQSPPVLRRILEHARIIEAEARRSFHAMDCEELGSRLEVLRRLVEAEAPEAAKAEAEEVASLPPAAAPVLRS